MLKSHSCPPADQLHQLAVGSLAESAAADVESHLLECETCQQIATTLNVQSDRFVESVRDAATQAAALTDDDRSRVDKLIEQASGLISLAESASMKSGDTTRFANPKLGVAGSADLLADLTKNWRPAQGPGELGRLGSYRVLKLLGSGGMAGVFLAEDLQLKRPVALKVMHPRVAELPAAAERFLREAQAAAAVRHENVVTIYQVGEDSGVPFIAQELLSGETLGERLKRGRLSPVEAVSIARQMAAGLAAAHVRGLVHRDVKPANVWLESGGEEGEKNAVTTSKVKLLDFGLARPMTDDASLTQSGMIVGTPNYMSPEQASGEPVDGRTDLFSLGCVLHQMLTGQQAFAGTSILAVLSALANHHPPQPRDVVPDVPRRLSDLTVRLLEKSPEKRPASAAEVAAELRQIEQQLAENEKTIAFAPAKLPHPPQGSRRVPVWAWGMVGVVLVALLGLGGWAATHDWQVAKIDVPSGGTATVVPAELSPPVPQVEEGPLRVTAIDVQHFAKVPEGDVLQGLLGKVSFSPRLGDRVQITAKLSKPAYAYLIAFRPDGVADLCFPADEETPPPLTDTPRYPLNDGLKAYGLREGAGLWVFAVITSERPLPAYKRIRQKLEMDMAWKPNPNVAPGVVWWDDGLTNVDHFTAGGMARTLRGKDESLEGPAAAIKLLTDSLLVGGRADTASAIGFCVLP